MAPKLKVKQVVANVKTGIARPAPKKPPTIGGKGVDFSKEYSDGDHASVSVNRVVMWKNNPRVNDAAVPRLMEILKTHEQITPIVCDLRTGVVYKGNTTLKALKALGKPTVKVLFRDFPSEAAAIAYGIADNRASEFAEWDDDILIGLMEAPEIAAFESSMGFTKKDLDALMWRDSHGDIDGDDNIQARIIIKCDQKHREAVSTAVTAFCKENGIEAKITC